MHTSVDISTTMMIEPCLDFISTLLVTDLFNFRKYSHTKVVICDLVIIFTSCISKVNVSPVKDGGVISGSAIVLGEGND